MNETEQIAQSINKDLPRIKRGTLRFLGEWFGRPYDNYHTLIRCENEGNLLKLHFNENETLFVWSPRGLKISSSIFYIAHADYMRWEWFSYGSPKTPSNLRILEFNKPTDAIFAKDYVDGYEVNRSDLLPAVEII